MRAVIMLSREQKYIEAWERKQGRGKWQYITLTTVSWGLIIPFIIKLFMLALDGNIWRWQAWQATFMNTDYLLFTIYFLLTFFAYALVMWQLARQKYRQLKQKQEKKEEHSRRYYRH